MLVRYPAYRRYSEARIAVNDAMMALLIGSRLGEHALANSAASPDAMLPDLFGRINGIARLNRTVRDAASLLADAESHLVYMAIPYALSVHGSFLMESARLLREFGHDEEQHATAWARQPDLSKLSLDSAHQYIAERSRVDLSPTLLELFHVSRRVRNRIVHFSGAAGPRVRAEYRALSKPARDGWERLAGRPLPDAVVDGRLALREGELIGVLATSRYLAQEVSSCLAHTIERRDWAEVAVRDYREQFPQRYGERNRRLRRLKGFTDRLYKPLGITEDELVAAAAKSEE